MKIQNFNPENQFRKCAPLPALGTMGPLLESWKLGCAQSFNCESENVQHTVFARLFVILGTCSFFQILPAWALAVAEVVEVAAVVEVAVTVAVMTSRVVHLYRSKRGIQIPRI